MICDEKSTKIIKIVSPDYYKVVSQKWLRFLFCSLKNSTHFMFYRRICYYRMIADLLLHSLDK